MNNIVPILAIETSDNICGACIYFNDEKYFSQKIVARHTHSEKLFEVIESALSQAGLLMREIKSIAVSNGPGSFTGLRIGMAAAKGLSQSLQIPVILVPTFEAMALQISKYSPENGTFAIANKVGREEVYFAKFQIKSNNYIFNQELKIIPISDFHHSSDVSRMFGNFSSALDGCETRIPEFSAPDPEFIAKWAFNKGLQITGSEIDFIEPNYMKEFVIKEKKNEK